jgi:predicted PurR-regulated permease PerM
MHYFIVSVAVGLLLGALDFSVCWATGVNDPITNGIVFGFGVFGGRGLR